MSVSRRNKAAIAAAAGKSGFFTARRTQRSATVSGRPSLVRSVAGGPGEGRASSCEEASGSRALLRGGDGPGLSCGGAGLRGRKLRWEALAGAALGGGRRPVGNGGATAAGRGGRRGSSPPGGFAEGRADAGGFARRGG